MEKYLTARRYMVIYITSALMVELVDTTDLKSVDLLVVRVQVPLKALFLMYLLFVKIIAVVVSHI